MLYSAKGARKCRIRAKDGEIGSVYDFFFDQDTWLVRYVVVDTGRWLPGKKVLVPRESMGSPDWTLTELDVDLTRDEIENGPSIDSDPPLSREARRFHYRNHVWTSYPWGGFVGGVPAAVAPTAPEEERTHEDRTSLRSVREILDYRIEARDGSIGHVEDFLFDATDWLVRYVVIDTRNWLPGKKVVVPPSEIVRMEWSEQRAWVDMTRDGIERAPALTATDASKLPVPGTRLLVIQ